MTLVKMNSFKLQIWLPFTIRHLWSSHFYIWITAVQEQLAYSISTYSPWDSSIECNILNHDECFNNYVTDYIYKVSFSWNTGCGMNVTYFTNVMTGHSSSEDSVVPEGFLQVYTTYFTYRTLAKVTNCVICCLLFYLYKYIYSKTVIVSLINMLCSFPIFLQCFWMFDFLPCCCSTVLQLNVHSLQYIAKFNFFLHQRIVSIYCEIWLDFLNLKKKLCWSVEFQKFLSWLHALSMILTLVVAVLCFKQSYDCKKCPVHIILSIGLVCW
jgi:hypothetical protein